MDRKLARKFKPKHLSSSMYRKIKGEQTPIMSPSTDAEGVREELLTQGKNIKVKHFQGVIY